jgi:hypothetical protein
MVMARSGEYAEALDVGMKRIWRFLISNLFKVISIIIIITLIIAISILSFSKMKTKQQESIYQSIQLRKFEPCTAKSSSGISNRELHILTCDDFGKGRFLALNDAINTWNITSQNLWRNGVIMKNICAGRSWDHGSLTKSIAYLEYTSSVLNAIRRMNLSRIDKLHVMLMDSNTIWSVDSIQQIWDRYDCARGDKEILVSSEMGYHGDPSHIDRLYGKSQTPTYSSFVNSGVIMGKAIFIEEMLHYTLLHNQSYYSHHNKGGNSGHRRKGDQYHEQHAISDYALRVAAHQVAIDYHQQLTGGFAVHLSDGLTKPKGKSQIICRAKNGSIDYNCRGLNEELTSIDTPYYHFNESTCSIYRNLQSGMPGYQQLENLASHPVIWHGNGQDKYTYTVLSNQAMNCRLEASNSKFNESTPYANCPCVTDPRSDAETHPISYEICIINSSIAHNFLLNNKKDLVKLKISLVSEAWKSKDVSRCLAVIDLLPPHPIRNSCSYKVICPEACLPRPYTVIPVNWVKDFSKFAASPHAHIPITCSLTFRQIVRSYGKKPSISNILSAIAMRRMQECVEREYWLRPSGGTNIHGKSSLYLEPIQNTTGIIDRRDVLGLMIWVGSINRLDMSVAQSRMLHDQWQRLPENMIAGWIASEEQYSCRLGSGMCHRVKSNHSQLLKPSAIDQKSFGWQCAQRRPLRALAHVLWLYNPEFVYLLDDDTFVNIPHFLMPTSPLIKYIRTRLKDNPWVVGHLEEASGANGLISKQGILYGGRGYLMGPAVLNRLQSYQIYGPSLQQDKHRSVEQMKYLSILRSAYQQHHQCPRPPHKPCLKLQGSGQWRDYKAVATSAVRLIDLCVSLMSKEHTCFHSDHAMTHCLVHGAYADIVHIDCANQAPKFELSYPLAGSREVSYLDLRSCGRKTDKVVLTCHQHVYNRTDLSGLDQGSVLPELSAYPSSFSGCGKG